EVIDGAGHGVAGGVEPGDPVRRMAVAGDLVAHGGAQNGVVLDQKDAHGFRSNSLSACLTARSDAKLTVAGAALQVPVSFEAQEPACLGREREFGPCRKD